MRVGGQWKAAKEKSSGLRDSEARQMPKIKGTFARTREKDNSAEVAKSLPLRNWKPSSSGSAHDTTILSSMQSPPTFLETFDTLPNKIPNWTGDIGLV